MAWILRIHNKNTTYVPVGVYHSTSVIFLGMTLYAMQEWMTTQIAQAQHNKQTPSLLYVSCWQNQRLPLHSMHLGGGYHKNGYAIAIRCHILASNRNKQQHFDKQTKELLVLEECCCTMMPFHCIGRTRGEASSFPLRLYLHIPRQTESMPLLRLKHAREGRIPFRMAVWLARTSLMPPCTSGLQEWSGIPLNGCGTNASTSWTQIFVFLFFFSPIKHDQRPLASEDYKRGADTINNGHLTSTCNFIFVLDALKWLAYPLVFMFCFSKAHF